MSQVASYRILAKYYDSFAGKKRYKEWEVFLNSLVKKYKIEKKIAVDLACGTGINSKTLRNIGFEKVLGVDNSREMLAEAKKKYKDISFARKDFLSFSGKEFANVDLVTCFYDSLNYLLKESELKKTFKNVYNSLKIGGVFVFDLNTPGHAKGISNNKPSIFTNEDLFVIMDNKVKGRFWFLNLSILVRKKGNTFSLFKEIHTEKMYEEGVVVNLLKSVGFKILETKKENKKYQDGKTYNNRIYYIVKK